MTEPQPVMEQAEQDRLTRQVGRALLTVAGDGWTQVRAEYRSAGRHVEVDVYVSGPDGTPVPVRPPVEVVEGLGKLRQGMYRPGRGTWLSALYLLDPPSSFSAEFEPDAEPRWRRLPPPIGFADELRFFPRADEHIPDWLRQRAGLPPAPGEQPPTPPGGMQRATSPGGIQQPNQPGPGTPPPGQLAQLGNTAAGPMPGQPAQPGNTAAGPTPGQPAQPGGPTQHSGHPGGPIQPAGTLARPGDLTPPGSPARPGQLYQLDGPDQPARPQPPFPPRPAFRPTTPGDQPTATPPRGMTSQPAR